MKKSGSKSVFDFTIKKEENSHILYPFIIVAFPP